MTPVGNIFGGEVHTDFGKEVMVRIQNMVTVYIDTIQITFKLAYISPVDIYNCKQYHSLFFTQSNFNAQDGFHAKEAP